MNRNLNLAALLAVAGGLAAAVTPAAAFAANPCRPVSSSRRNNPCAANPCAAKKANPCAAKANPCAANPCAARANPCAASPCAAKADPCAAKKAAAKPN